MSSKAYTISSLIIDNGSTHTRAGLSTDEIPSLVFPSLYSSSSSSDNKNVVIGHEIDNFPENDIYTLSSDGMVYNYEALSKNWEHCYERLDLQSQELPLVTTENSWNTRQNRAKLCELAFEKFEVPIFSIVKNSLCTSYSYGRSTSIVVDIGGTNASVTPIYNGIILNKGVLRSKFAGDFINLHCLNFLSKFLPQGQDQEDYLLPRRYYDLYANNNKSLSPSFKMYAINKTINDFKATSLQSSKLPISPEVSPEEKLQIPLQPRHYLLPNEIPDLKNSIVELNYEQYQLCEPLFKPSAFEIPGVSLKGNNTANTTSTSANGGVAGTTETGADANGGVQGIVEMLVQSLQKLEVSTDVYQQLLSNVIITGGSTLLPNIESRIFNEFQRAIPNLQINTYLNPNVLERNFSNWIGASILSSSMVNDEEFENIFISKKEYEEMGEDLIAERFK